VRASSSGPGVGAKGRVHLELPLALLATMVPG
jgi:hypothetical protein